MIDYGYLRPLKEKALKAWHENFFENAVLDCLQFDNAVILPVRPDGTLLFGKGGVIADGQYVELSGITGRVGGLYEYCEPVRSELSAVYCGYLPDHWGHFLIEGVARLWYVLDRGNDIDKFVFIVDENSPVTLKGNYKEFFELLGIIDKIELVSRPVEYKRVFVPELGYRPEKWYSENYLRIFDTVAANALRKSSLQDAPEKVFLSRSHFKKASRTEAGLEMLDSFFENNGYKILYPETISLTDLILYLQNAKLVAAESGSLPHNLLFAQRGKHCEIMERQTTPNELQANIDIMKQLDVTYVDCHYMIYPVSAGGGPYFLAYNKWMRSYAGDRGLAPPDVKYLSEKYLLRCLKRYMKAYERDYAYAWGLEAWMVKYADSLYEAYVDSFEDLGKYLNGTKPVKAEDYFSFSLLRKSVENGLRFAKDAVKRSLHWLLGESRYEKIVSSLKRS